MTSHLHSMLLFIFNTLYIDFFFLHYIRMSAAAVRQKMVAHSESRAVIRRRVLSNGTEDQLLTYIKGSCRPVCMDYYRFSYSKWHSNSQE